MKYTARQLEDLARQHDREHTAFADGMAAAYRHIADETEDTDEEAGS